jgi:hypothetical protein
MCADTRLHLAEPCRRLTLRHGKLYRLPLKEHGIVFELTAFNFHPDHREWQLIEGKRSCPADANPAHLLLQRDGTFEPDGDFGLDDGSGRFDAFLEAGVTVRDLEPADDLARDLWAAQFGDPAACPRCDAQEATPHHPLCHGPDGVPLFPDFNREHWLGEVEGQCAHWEQEIGLDAERGAGRPQAPRSRPHRSRQGPTVKESQHGTKGCTHGPEESDR